MTSPATLGHPVLDTEHMAIVKAMARLYDAIVGGEPAETISQIIDQVATFAAEHCAFEESLMQQMNTPGFAAHCEAHAGLLERLRNLSAAGTDRHNITGVQALSLLKGWTEHVHTYDWDAFRNSAER